MLKKARYNPGFPFRLLLFWLVLFQLARLILLLASINGNWPAEGPLVFVYSLRLDFSAACYLSAVPLLLYVAAVHFPVCLKWMRGFVKTELILVLILLYANFQVFINWGTLLNRRAITFLSDPGAIIASLSFLQIIMILVICTVLIIGLNRLADKILFRFSASENGPAKTFLLRFLWLLLLPVGIRGGLQLIPVNESAASFSNNMQLNMIAMNPPWYFMNNVLKSGLNQDNPYKKFAVADAENIVADMFVKSDSTILITEVRKPNIVLIVLESWTADLIRELGGDSSTTPFFSRLCKEGLLFTHIYSSGRRTDQMFPSLLSGFPAQPDHSIVRFPSKTAALPMLSRDLSASGYTTSFYYGGELGFANMKNYLMQGGFNSMISEEEFSSLNNLSKWGAHDEYVMNRHAADLSKFKQPFFTMLLTLSTHEPFDVPGSDYSGSTGEPQKFRTAAAYTDKCLEEYFSIVRKIPAYDSTLFILVADHGHLLPKERNYNDPAVYHIPLLVTGGALKTELRGKYNTSVGAQHDIPSTLLRQLGMSDSDYHWSNNLLNVNRNSFAYLNMDDATGWVDNTGQIVWYRSNGTTDNSYTVPSLKQDDERVRTLTSYIKVLFDDFLKN